MDKCNENSIASHSSTAKWWPDAGSICSWTGDANYASNPNPNSNCSGGEDNASNNSGISMESSRCLVEKASTNDPYGEAVSDNHHLWNQVFLGTGEMQNISTQMFEPAACDYLKKIDSGWEPTNLNQFQKNFNDGLYQSKNLNQPADVEIISPQLFDQYAGGQFTTIVKNEHTNICDIEREGLFRRGLRNNYMGGVGNNKDYFNGVSSDIGRTNGRGFFDLVAFGSSSPLESNMSNKPVAMMNSMNLSDDPRKPGIQNSYQPIRPRGSTLAKINGRGNGAVNIGKRKKSEDQSGSFLKKTKLETSTVSSTKIQLPKAKVSEKITALQQIVSPFGKTDTASVLWETIAYIKCLQEQLQLLSNPYMKTNIIKDPWVRLETKDRGDMKVDLKSRGLCLVPVSCTPKVYHENIGSDYWTPTYRGYF